jgi:hypothetical protein
MSLGSQHNLFYFSSLIFDKSYFSLLIFDVVLVCRRPANGRPNLHSLPDKSEEPAVIYVVAVEGGASINQRYTLSESEYTEDGEASCGTADAPAAAAEPAAAAPEAAGAEAVPA